MNKLECSCCGLKLDGWLYYEKGEIKICHFCYDLLVLKGEEQ